MYTAEKGYIVSQSLFQSFMTIDSGVVPGTLNSFAMSTAKLWKPGAASAAEQAAEPALRWQIQHVLFPAMARHMQAPKSLLDRDVVQVANLPELYRVFERC